MSDFTPGPWTHDSYGYVYTVDDREDSYGSICDCMVDTVMDEEEQLANARLIATAPSLLEACEAMVDASGTFEIAQVPFFDAAVKKARAAIRKAKGQDNG